MELFVSTLRGILIAHRAGKGNTVHRIRSLFGDKETADIDPKIRAILCKITRQEINIFDATDQVISCFSTKSKNE